MIEQARMLVEHGWNVHAPLAVRARRTRDIFEPRESHRARPPSGCVKAREALGERRRARHRLPPSADASPRRRASARRCRRARSTSSRSRSATRRRKPTRRCARMTDMPFAIGEEFASQVAVPALHRARHPPVQPHRRLQCRRLHRGDEGRRLERGALRRPDAAQPARADLHRGDRAFRRGRRRISPGSNPAPRPAETHLGFDDSEIFPVQPQLEGAALPGARRARPRRRGRRGSGCTRRASSSGRRRICSRRDGSFTNW